MLGTIGTMMRDPATPDMMKRIVTMVDKMKTDMKMVGVVDKAEGLPYIWQTLGYRTR